MMFIPSLYPGCNTPDTVWGYDIRKFTEYLQTGEQEFLLQVNFEEVKLSEALKLPQGGSFYTAVILEKAGLNRTAEELLILSWEKLESPWNREAAAVFCRRLIRQDRFVEAERFSEKVLDQFPGDDFFIYVYLESLYRQEKDELLLEMVSEYREVIGNFPFLDGEAALWQAVASYRLESDDWEEKMYRLFTGYEPALIHSRVFIYLQYQDPMPEFPDDLMVLFEAVARVSEYDWRKAETKFSQFFAPRGELLDEKIQHITGFVARGIYASAANTGRAKTWGGRLLKAAREGDDHQAVLFEYSGLCYRLARDYSESNIVLKRAYETAAEHADRDRILWYRLSSLYQGSIDQFIEELPAAVALIQDHGYFTDIFSSVLSALVDQRKWEDIYRIYRIIRESDAGESKILYGLMSFIILREGFLSVPPEEADLIEASFKQDTVSAEKFSYPSLIADAILDLEPHYPELIIPESGSRNSIEIIAEGYFTYHLPAEGYHYVIDRHYDISDLLLIKFASKLKEKGLHTFSIRLWNRLKNDTLPMSSRFFEAAYPKAFESTMEKVIAKYSLPEEFFYALIREESYFDSEVVSWAGAVGLAQLMPSTAEDISGRLRMEAEDLTDPEINLELGGWYFAWLLDMFELPLYALAAYNGGQGRVRQWIRKDGSLPTVLFAETIPLWETRGYIKKVLVTAVIYGYVYDRTSIRSTVMKVFPDLPDYNGEVK
ncbi:MAG: flagellar assembly lytic transglycosylase [Spirochaetia bacterium]